MASASVGVSVLSVELAGMGIAPGEKAAFRLKVESFGAGAVTGLSMQLVCLYSGGEAPVCESVNLAVNVPNNAAREYTVIFRALDADSGAFAWMRGNSARAAGDAGSLNAAGQVVLRCAWTAANAHGSADHTVSEHGVYLIDRRCVPAIGAFSMERCNDSGAADDEGEKLLVGIRLSVKDDTWLSNMTCHLYYAQDGGEVTELSRYVDLTDQISALLAGVQDSTTLVPLSVSRTSDWHFLLVFGDGWEQAGGGLEISRAFANLHLSGASTGGAAFGMFGTSAENSPKLESAYPAYLYGGVPELKVDWITLTPASGVTTPNDNNYGGGELKAGKIGSHVYIRGSVLAKSGATLCTLPSGYRPWDGNHYKIAPCGGARIARLYVARNGELYLEWVRNLSDGNAYTTAVWVDCAMDFWVYPDERLF